MNNQQKRRGLELKKSTTVGSYIVNSCDCDSEQKSNFSKFFGLRIFSEKRLSKYVVNNYLCPGHRQSIHGIREFSTQGNVFGDPVPKGINYVPFETLANKFCGTLAASVGQHCRSFHCTIKICEADLNKSKKDWKIWTNARSQCAGRRKNIGIKKSHTAGKNTGFAALLQCEDGLRLWTNYYSCFVCNDLEKYSHLYTDCNVNHLNFYKSTIVFPIKLAMLGASGRDIMGFLTIDSALKNVFTNAPCIFDYLDDYGAYNEALQKCEIFHVGASIADLLSMQMFLQKKHSEYFAQRTVPQRFIPTEFAEFCSRIT